MLCNERYQSGLEVCCSCLKASGLPVMPQALWRRRVRSFSAPEAATAAAAPSRQPDTQLSGQHSDLNERWTAALSTAVPAPALES